MSKSKYDPIISDDVYWKYQGVLESFMTFLQGRPDLLENKQSLVDCFAHISRKIYDMGYVDAQHLYGEPQFPKEDVGSVSKIEN